MSSGSAGSLARPDQPSTEPTLTVMTPSPEDHWTLGSMIEASKFLGLLRLPRHLNSTNYIAWASNIKSALTMVRLFEYCPGDLHRPTDPLKRTNWDSADALVRTILLANITDDLVPQLAHLETSSRIWLEARCLFSGQTATDWMLTVMNLVSTRYVNGEDILAHITKMKAFRRDLLFMNRDVDDELFVCFLRISMPPTWNYVFSGLPDTAHKHEF
jgi:gag-polypeptide of LTR copia-type